MDESSASTSGENWISVDPKVDYDETLAKIQETVDAYPGIYRDVQTYLKERIREVLTGSSEARSWSASSALISPSSRRRREEVKGILEDIDGVVRIPSSTRARTSRRSRSRSISPPHGSTASSPVTFVARRRP